MYIHIIYCTYKYLLTQSRKLRLLKSLQSKEIETFPQILGNNIPHAIIAETPTEICQFTKTIMTSYQSSKYVNLQRL